MSSFPSLHDALSSLLHGARGGPEWMLGQGMPGFGDRIDTDERRGDPARGPEGPDLDIDAVVRSQHHANGGNGSAHQGYADTGSLPFHARQALSEPLRGPVAQPLTPSFRGQGEPPLLALARELQLLPPSVIRQLSDALASNPDALRELPARPEALAVALSRTVSGPAEGMQAAAAEARRLAHGGDAASPLPRGQDAEEPRDPRQPGAVGFSAEPRGAADARAAALLEARQAAVTEARSGWTGGMDPALTLGPAVRAQAMAEAQPASPARAEPPATAMQMAAAPAGSSHAPGAAAAAGSTQASASAPASSQDAIHLLGARAEVPGSTADRGAQPPGLAGLGGAAAGVTLAAIGQPAGTTHAYAPDSAVRARGAQARDQERRRGDARDDEAADGRRERNQGRREPRSPDQSSSTAAAGVGAAARAASGQATAGSAMAGHSGAPATRIARPDDVPGPAARDQDRDAQARESRQRQWLYWSLIGVTYGCLGLALATVAPELFGLPIAAGSTGTWRNALTGAGLLTGLWAWLVARRMR